MALLEEEIVSPSPVCALWWWVVECFCCSSGCGEAEEGGGKGERREGSKLRSPRNDTEREKRGRGEKRTLKSRERELYSTVKRQQQQQQRVTRCSRHRPPPSSSPFTQTPHGYREREEGREGETHTRAHTHTIHLLPCGGGKQAKQEIVEPSWTDGWIVVVCAHTHTH